MDYNLFMKKGRPKGSNSFVAVDISRLVQLIDEGEVAVSKKFLESLGIDVNKFRPLHTRDLAKIGKKKERVEMVLS